MRRFCLCVNNLLLGRIILFLGGFFRLRGNSHPFNSANDKPRAKSGTLLLCNHTSFWDVVFLLYGFSPKFLRLIVFREENKYMYQLISNWQLFSTLWDREVFLPIQVDSATNLSTVSGFKLKLEAHVQNSRERNLGSCVVFWEGVQTNGQGYLDFDYEAIHMSINRAKFIFYISYSSPLVAVPNPARSQLLHLCLGLANFWQSLSCRASGGMIDSGSGKVRQWSQSSLQSERLSVGWQDYMQFSKMWRSCQDTKYIKSQ